MRLLDKLRSIVAQGESVASDEIGAVVPAWRNFIPKWSSYSRTGKVLAILIPVTICGVLYGVGINALEFAASRVFRGSAGEHPIATKADLKTLQDQVDNLRNDLAAKPSSNYVETVKASIAASAQTLKASSPTLLEFNQLQDDVRQLQTEFEAFNKKSAPITTGSVAPKKKKPVPANVSPSLIDPSSWKILP